MVAPTFDHDTRTVRPEPMEVTRAKASSSTSWLTQIEEQAKSIPQPRGCLPVAAGMALDQLLTKLRLAADIEVVEAKDKSEASLRALPDASLYELTEHVYENLDMLVEQLKWRWRAENATFAERANAWRWRRQGWFFLLGETDEGSVLVSADRQLIFLVRGMERSLSSKLRVALPDAQLPAAVWLTLLPWEGRIAFDGLMACRVLPDQQRNSLQRDLQPCYERALAGVAVRVTGGAEPVARAETAHEALARQGRPEWVARAFGGGEGGADDEAGDEGDEGDEEGARLVHRLRPELARYDKQATWPGTSGSDVMGEMCRAAKAEADKAFKAGAHARAARLYSVALSSFPPREGEPALLGNRSLCHLRLGESAAALSDALAATIGAPGWAKGWARKAAALQAMADLTGALDAAEQATRLAPDDRAFALLRDEIRAQLAAAAPAAPAAPTPPAPPEAKPGPTAEQVAAAEEAAAGLIAEEEAEAAAAAAKGKGKKKK